ncbi:hypothetical protein HMI54_007026 [Coelomomyces lativittatus]|nr:hypothetical protein HMI54_007026 [Coelomomyces lativittatus]
MALLNSLSLLVLLGLCFFFVPLAYAVEDFPETLKVEINSKSFTFVGKNEEQKDTSIQVASGEEINLVDLAKFNISFNAGDYEINSCESKILSGINDKFIIFKVKSKIDKIFSADVYFVADKSGINDINDIPKKMTFLMQCSLSKSNSPNHYYSNRWNLNIIEYFFFFLFSSKVIYSTWS